jgi:heme-degrading monooxygenase HmoA
MIAVIFEVHPRPGQQEAYLDATAALRPLLTRIDGFISIERIESLTSPGKIVSLSYWFGNGATWSLTRGFRARAGRSCLPTIGSELRT